MSSSVRAGILGVVVAGMAVTGVAGCAAAGAADDGAFGAWDEAGPGASHDGGSSVVDARGGDEHVAPVDAGPDARATSDAAGEPDADGAAPTDGPVDAAADAPDDALPGDASADVAADAPATGCQYTTVFQQAGPVLTVGSDVGQVYYWSTQPLPDGGGFYCMKVDFDMQTADTLAGLGGPDAGCPIYTLVTGIHGTGPKGTPPSQSKLMAGALFKFYTTSCAPGTHRIELDTAWSGDTVEGPWNLGDTFHFTIEVKPYTSTVTLTQNGVAIGPTITASITGATVADTVNPKIDFGDPAKGGGSNWPNYGAVYSNVVIQADVAP
jgi:hypothetical protein